MCKFLFLTLALSAMFYSACSHVETDPKVLKLECELDHTILDHSKVITVSKEGNRLYKGDMNVEYPYQISSRGCIIIPKKSDYDLVIKSNSHGKRVKTKDIPEGFSLNYVELDKFLSNFQVWSYCGEELDENEMFLMFENVDNLELDSLVFADIKGKNHPIAFNDNSCAKVPKLPGRVKDRNSIYSTVYYPNEINLISSEPETKGDFLSVCKKKGNDDPIVKTFSESYHETDCDKLLEKVNQNPYQISLLINKGIKDTTPLRGLDLIQLNLDGNPVTSLHGISEMKNLMRLSLESTDVIFLDQIPSSVSTLNIINTRISSLESCNSERLHMLRLSSSGFEDLSSLIRYKHTLKALFANKLKIKTISDLDGFEKLWFLDISGNVGIDIAQIDLPTIERLDVSNCGLSDSRVFEKYDTLENLDLEANYFTDTKPFESLHNLKILRLMGNKIRNVNFVKKLNKLQELNVIDCGIEDISHASALPDLRRIYASGNSIKDISTIAKMRNIDEFAAYGNPLKSCPENSQSSGVNTFCKMFNKPS